MLEPELIDGSVVATFSTKQRGFTLEQSLRAEHGKAEVSKGAN